MIEAVNSVIANVQISPTAAAQVDAAKAYASNPSRTQQVAQAPFVSPHIEIDYNYDRAVLQIRDGDTGDVLKQYPSETTLEAQLRAEATRQVEVQNAKTAQLKTANDSAYSAGSVITFEQTPESRPAPAPVRTTPKPEAKAASAALVAASQSGASVASQINVTA